MFPGLHGARGPVCDVLVWVRRRSVVCAPAVVPVLAVLCAGAAGMGPDPDLGGGECDYGTILSAADVVALLADHDEAPSPGTTFEAVLQQVLWDASDQYAVCCRGTWRALILRSLRGDVRAWEREWVADGSPPVCPRGLVPQLLEAAARADAELLRALWAGPFEWAVLVWWRIRACAPAFDRAPAVVPVR